jgi:hydroxypyruvate reductase
VKIVEAGHPVPDINSIKGAQAVLDMTGKLSDKDEILFLVSGGGSALFEKPADGITLKDIEKITENLIRCGADIVEINTIRKRLSAVKGGKFAVHCSPAKIFSVVLSDVIGDRLDIIASGPAYPDSSTTDDVLSVIQKYNLDFAPHIIEKLKADTPKMINNAESVIIGSVGILCREAANTARELGYEPTVLCSTLSCEARDGGRFLAAIAKEIQSGRNNKFAKPCAIIAGGETVVTVKGEGKGGRNQEFVLAAAELIDGYSGTVIFSVGSDGTDGPTDAAGGIVDGGTKQALLSKGIKISDVLNDNDSYNALKQVGGLVITGPTGTNVNDFAMLLCK